MNEVHVRTHADLKDIPLRQRDDAQRMSSIGFGISQQAYEIRIDLVLVERHTCSMRGA